jgi:hypothetical protein
MLFGWGIVAFSASFSARLDVDQKDYRLIGEGTLDYSIFKINIYHIAYYQALNSSSDLIRIVYDRDYSREYIRRSWENSLRDYLGDSFQLYFQDIYWLYEVLPDVNSGDELMIVRDNDRVTIFLNEKMLDYIESESLSEIIFLPWLGEKPISMELKKDLLTNILYK